MEPFRKNYLILTFFFLTGLTGLAYELVWIRLLILSFGSTQFAITTVLGTFMAGLALGSIIFGRVVDRYAFPLRVYAVIELVLGLYCILSPWIFSVVKGIYLYANPISGAESYRAGFEATQFFLALIVLIIPTTLMGGTLPALVKYLASRSGRIGFHTAVPYAVNTLGAVTGCLLTGFFALYALGVNITVYLAGAIDIVIGAVVLLLYAREQAVAGVISRDKTIEGISRGMEGRGQTAVVIAAFAISGFCSLAYEVLWTRVLSLVLGSSVYAFTIMLATFLVGIGVGSIAFASLVDRCKKPVLWFAVLEAVIGIFALASIFLYRELPFIFFNLKENFAEQFWFLLVLKFLLAAAVMIVPTLSMGAIFPLVNRIYSKGLFTIGRNVGDIYFFNTAGAIFGSFVGGFILIPEIGAQNGVVLIAALNIILSVVLIIYSGIGQFKKYAAASAFVVIFTVIALILPPWEKMAMTTGFYVNDYSDLGKELSFQDWKSTEDLLYYKEGLNAIITVRGSTPDHGIITYQANGKQEARAEYGKPPGSWSILGHVPLMLHGGKPDDALLIGLGSGVTLGAMEYYKLKSFDVVELEPAVVDAARFFSKANNNALDDPRVSLHVTDGRIFLSSIDKKYDIIVSGVSDPWISGVSNLFTYDYFMELKKKLRENGIVAIWFSNYRSTPEDFKVGLNSFAAVFPHTSVWFHYREALDLVVIGSMQEHSIDMERLQNEVFADPAIRENLAQIDVKGPYDVVSLFLAGDKDLRKYIGKADINTDERPILEFSLPRNLYMDVNGIDRVHELLATATEIVPPVQMQGEPKEFYLNVGKSYNQYSFRLNQALSAFEKVIELDPSDREAARYAESIRKELESR